MNRTKCDACGRSEPDGYAPPADAEELRRRYAAGERYFAAAQLAGARLDGDQLKGVCLREANLEGASVMIGPKAGLPLADPDLSDSCLFRARLSHAILAGCILDDANLNEADMSGVELDLAKLRRTSLRGARLDQLKNAELARFEDSDLEDASLANTNLKLARFLRVKMAGAQLPGANLQSTRLDSIDLANADLEEADFRFSKMKLVLFTNANLDGADLRGIAIDRATTVSGAHLVGTAMDRYTVEMLERHGGLQPSARSYIPLTDSLRKLRLSFSGFMQWVHLAALVIFLAPYILFTANLIRTIPSAKLTEGMEIRWEVRERGEAIPIVRGEVNADIQQRLIPLGHALWLYIKSAGGLPNGAWVAHFAFFFTIFYNITRGWLLWKTKHLEDEAVITGYQPQFSMHKSSFWYWMYELNAIGFFINIGVILLHTHHFMQTPVVFPSSLN